MYSQLAATLHKLPDDLLVRIFNILIWTLRNREGMADAIPSLKQKKHISRILRRGCYD